MPSILNATTNSGLVTSADNSGSLQLQTNNGTTAVTIDTSQNVGIGTTSPTPYATEKVLDVYGSGTTSSVRVRNSGGISGAMLYTSNADAYLWNVGNSFLSFGTNNGEKMRITSGGDLFINTTASSGYGLAKLQIFTNLTVAGGQTIQDTATTYSTSSEYIVFTNSSGSRAGSIQHTAVTTVAYNTSSDARLKQDLGVATDTSVIDNTIIHNFKWISNQADDVGVFAQEAHLVKPSAVSVGSDDLTEDGNLKQPWGVDYSKYVPDLIVYCQQLKKSIQELKAELDATKAEVQALKGTL